MLTLLHEVHFWTQKDVVNIKDTDFGAFKFYDKKQLPQGILFEGKKSYMLRRGLVFSPSNRRPQKLRDALKELEEILCHNRIVVCDWRGSSHIQIIVGSGLKINIKVNSELADIEEISFDKYMLGKLSSQYLCDVAVTYNQVVCTYTDNQVNLINFSKPLINYEYEKKWNIADPKIQSVELRGPAGRRVDKRISFNVDNSLMLIWWKCSNDEVYPWTPSVKDEERANIQIYSNYQNKLDLKCYFKTEYDPLLVSFSSLNMDIIHVIQQKISYMGEVTLEWSIMEVNHRKLETAQIISLLLPTHCCVVSPSPKEDKIFIGCIDGSILLADSLNNVTEAKKAYFIPSLASWHPDSSMVFISNERGQIQWFDRSLFCVKCQFLNEDSTATTILDLSSYFKFQPTLLSISWSRKSELPSTTEECDDMVLLYFERGPLVVVKLCCGKLTPEVVVSRYLSINSIEQAVNFLLTLDWGEESDSALSCMQAIVTHLLRLPLNPEREVLLEKALGSYHRPNQPIPESVIAEVDDSVHDLSRRFFHHLLRYQICDKAFSLAIDLEDYDLFMDLHNYGKIIGNSELALAALERAEQVFYSSSESSGSSCDCSDSCSCCSSESITSQRITPPPLPVLHQSRQKVKFSRKVTHIPLHQEEINLLPREQTIDPNMVGLPDVGYHKTTYKPNLAFTQASTSSLPDLKNLCLSTKTNKSLEEVDSGKIKVVHFGLV
ncbi:WD repeat-containing and planar cell polarity effector protein fritz homolog [Halyomorpha halys]|uniref:WD repeat-containing and planar cell polarity effector protein fritz homolog n=1 Tax=Halyomorpha halys TaxID=286706 RepID=UPI0006D51E27|nr:WD repeat-containing and planar cell polarity effector protein fritz homolog [Halyomorpha halys]